jgi:adenylate cyclase
LQRALGVLATHLVQTEGTPPLSMRIGINTGPAAVGNLGSELRLAYTALGDTVNLAARLEPLNNEYGTSICISEFTLKAAGEGRLLTRFLDLVAVRGRREPVAVYELLAERGSEVSLDEQTRLMLEPYERGIALYRALDFASAAACFKEALALKPEDSPSALYLERCRELLDDPPAPDWDGVFEMKHK